MGISLEYKGYKETLVYIAFTMFLLHYGALKMFDIEKKWWSKALSYAIVLALVVGAILNHLRI